MKLIINEVRIENFRSIKNASVTLTEFNLLLGQNNSGKSNFLSAIEFGILPYKEASANDIFWSKDEVKEDKKKAIIDIKIVPYGEGSKFDDFWSGVFTDDWIVSEGENEYVGIRTEIRYDAIKEIYVTIKKPVVQWGADINSSKIGNSKKNYNTEMVAFLNLFFMDALRDFSSDIRDKKSYFGKTTSTIKLPPEKTAEIESNLSNINEEIISSIDVIADTNKVISEVMPLLGLQKSSVSIEPMARTLNDLHRGMDVVITEENTTSFSVNEYGMGTKSWLAFLSLKAYVNYVNKTIKLENAENSTFDILLLEEPEAHLHPQAQKQLYLQLKGFEGQKIVSTHSENIVSQASLDELLFLKKKGGETEIIRFNSSKFSKPELSKIRREILKSNGGLLFANCVVLCEGITEEIEIPIYFEKYFGNNPNYYGISILGVGGKNYSAFIKLLDEFSIDWFIFSDGEKDTLNTLSSVLTTEIENLKSNDKLVYFDNYDCIESYLVRSGYRDAILTAIKNVDGPDFYSNSLKKNPIRFTKEVSDKNNVCPTCNRPIITIKNIDTNGLSKENYELFKFMIRGNNKTKYCEEIALQIVSSGKEIPDKFIYLFKKIEKKFNIILKGELKTNEAIK